MNIKELKKLTKGAYSGSKSAKFNIAILTKSPEIVLTYDQVRYEDPEEVTSYWRENPNDDAYKASDGYFYFNAHGRPFKPLRRKDIGDDIGRIVESEEMRRYLDNIANGPRLQIVPDNCWETFQIESGAPKVEDRIMYINACFNIPGEKHYKMSVIASKAESQPKIKLDVFITYPEFLHFDGMDHPAYPEYLSLVRGKILDSKLIKTAPLMLNGYN